MARPLRVQFRNGWYHVTARGGNRQNIYRDERDRLHFLELLGEMRERHTVEVHAYALMDNHYHLLLRTPLANLSRAVQWLNTAYGIWWNLRHRRVGHVFQGRFKSVVVESGQWVLECSLYIHLNPVAISGLELSKAKKKAERRGLTVAPVAVRAKRLQGSRGRIFTFHISSLTLPLPFGYPTRHGSAFARAVSERLVSRHGPRQQPPEHLPR
jgi:REP element-mobilizing transposase RayT